MKNLFLLTFFFATLASANTPIFHDSKFEVSVEEKSSRPGARGKGSCGAGQEIYLKVTSLPSKKVVMNELIESCLKTIDLEDSVDESVVLLDKKIFIFQTVAMGILDLSGDTPLYKTGSLPNEEVKSVVMKLENCDHWAGEEVTNEKRGKEIANNIKKLGCDKIPAQIEGLKKKITDDTSSLSYLEAAQKEYQ